MENMMNEITETNPYATPAASVEKPLQSGEEILGFPRFSAWWVLLLSILTLNFYTVYWLYSRTKIINRVLPKDPIYMGMCWTFIAFYMVNIGFAFLEVYYASNLTNVVSTIMMLVWAFSLRNRLNLLAGVKSDSKLRTGPVLTFFLQSIYLAYKINQIHDRVSGADSTEA